MHALTLTPNAVPAVGTPVRAHLRTGDIRHGRVLTLTVDEHGTDLLTLLDGAGRWTFALADVTRIAVTGTQRAFRTQTNGLDRPARLAFSG